MKTVPASFKKQMQDHEALVGHDLVNKLVEPYRATFIPMMEKHLHISIDVDGALEAASNDLAPLMQKDGFRNIKLADIPARYEEVLAATRKSLNGKHGLTDPGLVEVIADVAANDFIKIVAEGNGIKEA